MSYSPSLSERTNTPNSLNNHETTASENNNGLSEKNGNFSDSKNSYHSNDGEKDIDVLSSNGQKIDKPQINTILPPPSSTIASTLTNSIHGAFTTNKFPTKLNGAKANKAALTGNNNGQANSGSSYPCQFCDKSFPRLGYLKKHEQVSCFLFLVK